MPNADIASAAERSLTSQAELLTTLSLAVIGGLLAVIIRIRTHNSSSGNQSIELKSIWLMWAAMGAAGLAISLNYLISGMLVQIAPQLFSHSYDTTKAFSDQDFGVAPIGTVQFLSFLQFLAFVVSVGFGVFFVAGNSRA